MKVWNSQIVACLMIQKTKPNLTHMYVESFFVTGKNSQIASRYISVTKS